MKLQMLDQDSIENAPEILIYFWIETLGDFIFTMKRAFSRGASGDVVADADRAYRDQEALVELLKQREGFAFRDHLEYKQWYRWWNRWHKHELSEERWAELNAILKWDGTQTEETFVDWRPDGDWRVAEDSAPSEQVATTQES